MSIMNEFAYGVLAGFPAGAAAVALAGRLVQRVKVHRTAKIEPEPVAEHWDSARQTLVGHVVRRRSELGDHADKLAGDNPELREMLRYQSGV